MAPIVNGLPVAGMPGMSPFVSVPCMVLRTATLLPEAMTSPTSIRMSGVCWRIIVNIAIAPADLLNYEQRRDLGEGMKAFSKTVSEIMAAK